MPVARLRVFVSLRVSTLVRSVTLCCSVGLVKHHFMVRYLMPVHKRKAHPQSERYLEGTVNIWAELHTNLRTRFQLKKNRKIAWAPTVPWVSTLPRSKPAEQAIFGACAQSRVSRGQPQFRLLRVFRGAWHSPCFFFVYCTTLSFLSPTIERSARQDDRSGINIAPAGLVFCVLQLFTLYEMITCHCKLIA